MILARAWSPPRRQQNASRSALAVAGPPHRSNTQLSFGFFLRVGFSVTWKNKQGPGCQEAGQVISYDCGEFSCRRAQCDVILRPLKSQDSSPRVVRPRRLRPVVFALLARSTILPCHRARGRDSRPPTCERPARRRNGRRPARSIVPVERVARARWHPDPYARLLAPRSLNAVQFRQPGQRP